MKWFKHFSTAMDDLFVKDLERRFGDSGYAFWFKTLELIAAHGDDGVLTISWSNYREKLHKRRTQVKELLDFCSTSGKLLYVEDEDDVVITCKKFAEFADNYTKYDGASTKRLQRQKEMSTKQEEEVEEEQKEKKKEDTTHPDSLPTVVKLFQERNYPNAEEEADKFWNYYESNGWRVGKNPMKNWKAAAANWNKNAKLYRGPNGRTNTSVSRRTGSSQTDRATFTHGEEEKKRLAELQATLEQRDRERNQRP